MDFQLTEEQKMMVQMVHDLAENEVSPRIAALAEGEPLPVELRQTMAKLGLLGVPFLFPGLAQLVLLGLGALALVLLSVLVAALLPTLRISFQYPALSMRE